MDFRHIVLIAHSALDWLLGLLLILCPTAMLHACGWQAGPPIIAQLLGCALLGFGTLTWFIQGLPPKGMRAVYGALIVWNAMAILVVTLNFAMGWGVAFIPLLGFAFFCGVFGAFLRAK